MSAEIATSWRQRGIENPATGARLAATGLDPTALDSFLVRHAEPILTVRWINQRAEVLDLWSERVEWASSGFTPTDAKAWHRMGATPQEAQTLREFGFTIEDMTRITDDGVFVAQLAPLTTKLTRSEIDAWLEMGMDVAAHRWAMASFAPADAQRWLERGFDANDAAGWSSSFSPSAASRWRESGFTAEAAVAWDEHSFDAELAQTWSRSGFPEVREALRWINVVGNVVDAAAWRSQGFAPAGAAAWIRYGFVPRDAVEWKRRGASPAHANALRDVLSNPSQLEAWTSAGLPVEAAITWARQGFSPDEAHQWRSAGVRSPQAAQTVRHLPVVLGCDLVRQGLAPPTVASWFADLQDLRRLEAIRDLLAQPDLAKRWRSSRIPVAQWPLWIERVGPDVDRAVVWYRTGVDRGA